MCTGVVAQEEVKRVKRAAVTSSRCDEQILELSATSVADYKAKASIFALDS